MKTETFYINNVKLKMEDTVYFDTIYSAFREIMFLIEKFSSRCLPDKLEWEYGRVNPDHGIYLNRFNIDYMSSPIWINGSLIQREPYVLEYIVKSTLNVHYVTKLGYSIPSYDPDNKYPYSLFLLYEDGGELLPESEKLLLRNTMQITLRAPKAHFEQIKQHILAKSNLE